MKKLLSMLLALCLSLAIPLHANAEELSQDNARFYIADPVTNKKCEISYNDYLRMVGNNNNLVSSMTFKNTVKSAPVVVLWYVFTPTSYSSYLSSKRYRVSDTYGPSIASISVTKTASESRSVTNTGGVQFTSNIWKAVDQKVTAQYSVAVSATSSTSSSVTGTFTPTGHYNYNWVYFQPRMARITGTLCRVYNDV